MFSVASSPSISSSTIVTTTTPLTPSSTSTNGPNGSSLAPPPSAALRDLYASAAAGAAAAAGTTGHPLASLVSQQRLLELSRFGIRHYDLAQHMLTQQGAVTKLLGKQFFLLLCFLCV